MATRFIDKEYGTNSSTAIANDATGTAKVRNLPDAAGFVYDSVDNVIKYNGNDAIVALVDASSAQTLTSKVLTSPTITTGITPTADNGAALGTTSLQFSDLFLATGGVINWNNGNVALTQAAGKLTMSVAAPTTSINAFEVTMTSGSATPGTIRSLVGSATSFTTMTSGNMVGARGQATLGGNISGTAFVYGAQGKVIGGSNSIAVGSSMVYGVMGQLDLSGTTVTNGYVAGVGSDIFGVSSGTVAADLFYGQHADGGTINSYFRAYGKSTYVFEFDTNGGAQVAASAGSAATKYLVIRVDGVTYKIDLLANS